MRLIVDNLSQSRGSRVLFEGLSFVVDAGAATVLKGPNGSGKTTLLRTIAGLAAPRSGTIRLEGGDADASVGEQAHWVAHANAIKGSFTVAENACFWRDFLGGAGQIDDALRRLDLLDLADIPAAYLSAGQKRRLGLTRLLLAKRPLWLLDEPTVSLDTASQEQLARLMRVHVSDGGLLIAATHIDLGMAGARTLDLSKAITAQDVAVA